MKKSLEKHSITIEINLDHPVNVELLEEVVEFLPEECYDDKGFESKTMENYIETAFVNKEQLQHALNDAVLILQETINKNESSFVNQQDSEIELVLDLELNKIGSPLELAIDFLESIQSDSVDLAELYGVPYDAGYHGTTYGYTDPFDYALREAIVVL